MPGFRISITMGLLWAAFSAALSGNSPVVHYVGEIRDNRLMRTIEQLVMEKKYDSLGVILSDHGYLDNQLNIAGDTIIVEFGVRYQLGDIDLSVIDLSGEARQEIITSYRSLDASRENVTAIKQDILDTYVRDGHYFASLNTDRISLQSGKISPEFKLITGPVVKIQRVRFKGLKKSSPEFIRHLSGLREGEPFSSDRLREAIRRIEAGDFLRNDSTPAVTPNENYDGVELLFYLSELKSNRLELGGGYIPGRGTEEGQFVGRLRFESKNLFGSGRRIDLTLDRKDKASSRVEFRFAQPFFIPDHLEMRLHFSQVDYDSTYHSFTIDGSLSLITRGRTRIGAGLSWTKTEPQRSSQPPSRTLAAILQYEIQKLDYSPNPAAGHHLAVDLSYIRRTSRPDSVTTAIINNESKFEVAADNYFHLGRGLVVRLNLETRVLITSRDLIDYSEQFKLGGFGSLRGYRQDQFAGRRTALGQAEIRLRPSANLAGFIFTDIGYVYSKKEIQPGLVKADEMARIGSGAGLFVGGPTARMTLEIGWGRHNTIDQGKIHFGLVTLF